MGIGHAEESRRAGGRESRLVIEITRLAIESGASL